MKDFEHLIYKICLFSFFRTWRRWQIYPVANIAGVCKKKQKNNNDNNNNDDDT